MIDDKEAIQSLKSVDEKGKSTAQKFGDVAKKGMAIGAAVVTGTVAAAGALVAMATKTAATTDRVDKLSQKIGMSREGFQEWEFIASQSGMEIEKLQVGFKSMRTAMDSANEGTGKGAEAFEKLGVSMTDANGVAKDQETVFEEAVTALQGMEDGAEKASLATDLFGKAGLEMQPLLNGAVGSVEEMKKQAHDLGLVLDDETIDAGVAFTDTMDQAQRALGSVVTKIGAEVMPIVVTMLDWIIAHMPQIQAVMSTVFGVIGQVVTTAVDVFKTYLLPAFQQIFEWVQQNWPQIKETIKVAVDTIKNLIQAFVTLALQIWDKWGAQIKTVTTTVFSILKTTIDGAMKAIKIIIDIITAAISGDWKGVWDGIKSYFSNVLDTIKNIAKVAIDGLKAIMSDKVQQVVNTIKTKFEQAYDAIMSPINRAKTAVSNAIQAMKGFFNFNWKLPSIKMPHFSVSGSANPLKWLTEGVPKLNVDWYAKGGIFDKPTLFNTANGLKGVGEAGPEVVAPLHTLKGMLGLDDERSQKIELNLSLNIEEFINNTDSDIDKISERLAFELNRKLAGGGLIIA